MNARGEYGRRTSTQVSGEAGPSSDGAAVLLVLGAAVGIGVAAKIYEGATAPRAARITSRRARTP